MFVGTEETLLDIPKASTGLTQNSEVEADLVFNKEIKFNRKQSGLSHSYLNDSQLGVIQSANKAECRVVWSKTVPTQDVFENLPANTSAAYNDKISV